MYKKPGKLVFFTFKGFSPACFCFLESKKGGGRVSLEIQLLSILFFLKDFIDCVTSRIMGIPFKSNPIERNNFYSGSF